MKKKNNNSNIFGLPSKGKGGLLGIAIYSDRWLHSWAAINIPLKLFWNMLGICLSK